MQIINDILGLLNSTEAPVHDLRVCLHATCVWSHRLGLASTPRLDNEIHRPQQLAERTAGQLAALARSSKPIEAAVGLAAINSLLAPPEETLQQGNAYQLLLARGENRDVTVVGHFPFVDRLRPKCRNLWVLELAPREGDLPATSAAQCIPRSDVVAITSSTLINNTLEHLLELTTLAPRPFVILLGPSTPLCPALFDHGIHALGGTVADRPEEVLRSVSEGASFRFASGLRPVLMQREP